MSREPLFARISLANKIMLAEKCVSLNRKQGEVLEEILDAFRLKREFNLEKKEDNSNRALQVNKKKAKELKDKRKARRGKK